VFALNQDASTLYLDNAGRCIERSSGRVAAVPATGNSAKRQNQAGALISFVGSDSNDVACQCSFNDANAFDCACNGLTGLVISQAGLLGVGTLDGFSTFVAQGTVDDSVVPPAPSTTTTGVIAPPATTTRAPTTTTKRPTTTTKKPTTTTKKPTTTKTPQPYCRTNNHCYKTIKAHWKKGNKFCKALAKNPKKTPPKYAFKACGGNRKKIASACKCLPKSTPKPAPYRPPPPPAYYV
jgi:hypothetical protein